MEKFHSELEKEMAFREKRSTELEMLERALQQQDADFDREISKLKNRKNLPSDTWLHCYLIHLLTYLS